MADRRFDIRWTPKRKTALVLEVLRTRTPPERIAHRHGVPLNTLAVWVCRFIEGGEEALRRRDLDRARRRARGDGAGLRLSGD